MVRILNQIFGKLLFFFTSQPFNELDIVFDNGNNFLRILGEVSPHKHIRDACTEVIAELSKFAIEMRYKFVKCI
jgi:hypothetical protein